MKYAVIMSIVAAMALPSCKKVDDKKKNNKITVPPNEAKTKKTSPHTRAKPKRNWRGVGLSGKVVETMDSGGYTYAKLDVGGKPVWVAGPRTPIKVGQTVLAAKGTPMTNFRSSTLNRTFATIHFVPAFGRPPGTAGGHAPGNTTGSPHAKAPANGSKTTTAPGKPIAPAAGGKTVAGLFAEKATLAGKKVVVRGKVVKFSARIMGRNWIHLRDGTGKRGTNDITITTKDSAAVGDVVTVSGTAATNKNFGGGYQYELIIENATVTKK